MNAIKTLALAAGLLAAGAASAATDTLNLNTNYMGGSVGDTYTFPTAHAALGASSSATLDITAYDVDSGDGEADRVFGYDAATSSWLSIGLLSGSNDSWSTSSFSLASALLDDVAGGLQLKVVQESSGWLYSLGTSTLTTVSAVPETETYAMFLAGLAALGAVSRRRKQA